MSAHHVSAFRSRLSTGRWKLLKVLTLAGCSLGLLLLLAAPALAIDYEYGYAVMWDGGNQVVLGSLGGLNSRALDINRAGAGSGGPTSRRTTTPTCMPSSGKMG